MTPFGRPPDDGADEVVREADDDEAADRDREVVGWVGEVADRACEVVDRVVIDSEASVGADLAAVLVATAAVDDAATDDAVAGDVVADDAVADGVVAVAVGLADSVAGEGVSDAVLAMVLPSAVPSSVVPAQPVITRAAITDATTRARPNRENLLLITESRTYRRTETSGRGDLARLPVRIAGSGP